jgi:hypothetical protein
MRHRPNGCSDLRHDDCRDHSCASFFALLFGYFITEVCHGVYCGGHCFTNRLNGSACGIANRIYRIANCGNRFFNCLLNCSGDFF